MRPHLQGTGAQRLQETAIIREWQRPDDHGDRPSDGRPCAGKENGGIGEEKDAAVSSSIRTQGGGARPMHTVPVFHRYGCAATAGRRKAAAALVRHRGAGRRSAPGAFCPGFPPVWRCGDSREEKSCRRSLTTPDHREEDSDRRVRTRLWCRYKGATTSGRRLDAVAGYRPSREEERKIRSGKLLCPPDQPAS